MRRTGLIVVVAVVGVVAVVVAGLGIGTLAFRLLVPTRPSTGAASGGTTAGTVDWGGCSDATLRTAGAQCATVTLPMDWSHPDDGQTVRIAISRVRHTSSTYNGVILVNPGGPGASGLGLATTGAQVPGGVGARYDWIGFDPRGIGASRPRLTCERDYANGPRPPYTPATKANIAAWLTRSEAYAKACTRNGELLDHMKTTDLARDMDGIRAALGVPTISYYGYSYGTYLGQVYATLFPTRLKRMVLDSTVDPSAVWYQANLDQDAAFQVAIEHWFAWVAEHDSTYHLGSTTTAVEQRFEAEQAKVAADPAQGVFGSAEWADTFLYAGYAQSLWPGLASAFAQASQGSYGQAIAYWRGLNDPTDDNEFAGYLATECTDATWPSDWATWQRDAERLNRTAPFGTWLNTWFNAPCRTWPAKAGTPTTIDGSKVGGVLMIDQTLDAATPFAGSLAVRGLFPKASLIAEPGGTSHADSLSGNACVDDAIAAYLADGTLPARKSGDGPDATCKPLPEPTP